MEISTEKSKLMTNSTNNVSADISMNGQKLEEATCFKYLVATLYKFGMLNRNALQDCLSNNSSDQIKEDLAVQHHQFRKQVQVVQVSCHPHHPQRL